MKYPKIVQHWISNQSVSADSGEHFEKYNPATGKKIADIARGAKSDVDNAINAAVAAFDSWSQTNVVERGTLLREATKLIEQRADDIAEIVHLETGKALSHAKAEVGAAVEMGYFVAGEGRRYYGKTTVSGIPHRTASIKRQPVGVCGLIIAANTPIANVAWKAFPALLCGNTVIMKASEDTPYTANWFAEILNEVGIPAGVFNIVHGLGEEAGAPIVEDSRVDLISFTGSVPVGRWIQKTAGERLAKVCLELGGKNAFVVCDDADLEQAAEIAVQSAFSNAGQRCASGSRLIIFGQVYDEFKKLFIEKTSKLKLGATDNDDYGPVINERQLLGMLEAVSVAVQQGAQLVTGGQRYTEAGHANGYYCSPTVIEGVAADDAISQNELFGPITILYKVHNLEEAIILANNSSFGLTSAIHTKSLHRAQMFEDRIRAGVVSVNGPTHGSEPHMPFGGLKDSGNGWREAGTEALDVYSDWKTIYVKYNPNDV